LKEGNIGWSEICINDLCDQFQDHRLFVRHVVSEDFDTWEEYKDDVVNLVELILKNNPNISHASQALLSKNKLQRSLCCLEEACLVPNNFAMIESLLQTIVPSQTCLDNVVESKNFRVIPLLISKGLVATQDNLKQSVEVLGDETLNVLLKSFLGGLS
jgi:hypothetical protein